MATTSRRRPSDSGFYQEPPNGWAYSTDVGGGSWYLPAGAPASASTRPTRITQTPMGPMAVGALPEGWRYDQYGNAVMTDGNGVNWTYNEEGKPSRIVYSGGVVTGAVGAAAGPASGPSVTITPATEEEIKNNVVPVSLMRRDYRKDVKASIAAADKRSGGGPFGVTSPGTIDQDSLPASAGGPLNDPNFAGADLLREATAAQNPDWSTTQIDEYVRSYSVMKAARQQSKAYYEPSKETNGTYYQRYAIQKAMSEGYGRPQYKQGEEYRVLNMDQMALIQLQQQLIQAKIPGSSSIVIGQVGDLSGTDATITAYKNALAGANLRGIPLDAYLGQAVKMAQIAERAGLQDGSPGDPKFDPTKVQTIVNLTGRARARAQLRSMMTQMLGRAPTEAEVNDYLGRLNDKEEADPTVRTTTFERDGDSSTTTDTTDVDPVLIGERLIKKENPKEYRANQELEYYNAMLSMMGES